MRTTITLDDDLYAKLQAEAVSTGRQFKVVLNETLRLGIQSKMKSVAERRNVELKTYALGLPEGLSYDDVQSLLDRLES